MIVDSKRISGSALIEGIWRLQWESLSSNYSPGVTAGRGAATRHSAGEFSPETHPGR